MSERASSQRIEEIRERLKKAWAGPWSWSRTYQISDENGDLQNHWCIHNPESEAKGQCIDGFLVLHTTARASYGGQPLPETPNFALIANAPTDLAFLLSLLEQRETETPRSEDAKDAERWRYFRQFLEVMPDDQSGGEYLFIWDDKIEATFAKGWDHTVDDLVDQRIAEDAAKVAA